MQNRKHIVDPTVTLIMNTCGAHQDTIAPAIRSFLAQTYSQTQLLIINTHPQRLVLQNVPDGAKIDVHNVEDVFTRPVHQYRYGMSKVVTDCWSILDDDDMIEPDHVTQLVRFWDQTKDRTEKPLQVCSPHIIAVYEDTDKSMELSGWMCSLFERLSPEELELLFRRFPPENICGADSWIASNSMFDKRIYHGIPTYRWDRRGAGHVSCHEKRPNESHAQDAFWYARNYWTIKLTAQAAPLRTVDLQGGIR